MTTTKPTISKRATAPEPTAGPMFARSAGALAVAAGTLLMVGQLIWWPFDQQGNLATSQNAYFNLGSVVYLAAFCVLVFALIGVHGHQAARAGRLGTFGFSAALLGTVLLGGDLWFETFAVPWLAGTASSAGLSSTPSMLMGLGAVASYLLFAFGWVSFGVASLRARVFPIWISLLVVVGGIVGFRALLAPWGILLGAAIAALGLWLLRARSVSASRGADERPASAQI